MTPSPIPPPQGEPPFYRRSLNDRQPLLLLTALGVMVLGFLLHWPWLSFSGTLAALLLSLRLVMPAIADWIARSLTREERITLLGFMGLGGSLGSLGYFLGLYGALKNWLDQIKWDEFGSWAEWVGAVGQISIAVLAVYVAWEQYVISRDLTIQQNRITQQQTIDTYFQGISDLALNDEGLLEDWPQERMIADGRTAAILSSVDAQGKAKILRFLSQSKLLTPLKRDGHLGRPILDGSGGYLEDRDHGIRVVDLGVMLAGADLAQGDLRWVDLSEANIVRANLRGCDLARANLSRTVLYETDLSGADLKGARLFYGEATTASPRSKTDMPNYETGAYTGAVVENADLSQVQRMDEAQRYYCCCWGGEKTRATIPGGCAGIPNKLVQG